MGKKGFTIIEISLFLAITGLLFFGVTIGVQTSISNQRNNDSVQSFVEFLRTAYSEVSNVQNIHGGKSDWALYGKLITFGENKGKPDQNTIYSYDVIGNADGKPAADKTLDILKGLNADVVSSDKKLVGIPGSYIPKWGAGIEPACSNGNCNYTPFEGALLIVRHPDSGIIHTYVSNKPFKVNETFSTADKILFNSSEENYSFKIEPVDFCINPDPGNETKNRRDVRIIKNARNSSGVEIIPDDQSKCRRNP